MQAKKEPSPTDNIGPKFLKDYEKFLKEKEDKIASDIKEGRSTDWVDKRWVKIDKQQKEVVTSPQGSESDGNRSSEKGSGQISDLDNIDFHVSPHSSNRPTHNPNVSLPQYRRYILGDQENLVAWLKLCQGYTYKAIARVTGVKQAKLRKILQRAKEKDRLGILGLQKKDGRRKRRNHLIVKKSKKDENVDISSD
jgi:hypothetical protein